jgi:hypothetical protein
MEMGKFVVVSRPAAMARSARLVELAAKSTAIALMVAWRQQRSRSGWGMPKIQSGSMPLWRNFSSSSAS